MILFDFRQRVQTYTRRVRAPSWIRTFWRFGLKRRRVAIIEWLREFPNAGPLPQLKHTLAMGALDGSEDLRAYPTASRISAIRVTATAALRP